MNEDAYRDGNFVTAAMFHIDGASRNNLMMGQIDQSTGRILVDNAGGSGTVTSFAFTDANGFHGVVTNPTTTPTLTLSNTVNGIVKSNGTSMSAASATTDYAALAFKTISVSGQSDVVADSPIDTLTLAAGANITITTNAGTDTITIAASGSTGVASVTGTTNRITISGTATDPIVDIAATYVGQTSITTLGTITTGVWTGTAVASANIATALTGKTYNGLTITTSSGTFTLANSKVFTVSNTLTFTGTDGSSVAFGTGGTVLYSASTIPLTVGSTTIASGADTKVLFDNAGVLGEYTISGSGTVAMTTSPTFVTPTLGAATATSINKVAITAPASSATITIADGKTLTVSNSITLAGTDGKGINVGAATSGKFLIGDGTNMVLSTSTIPTSAGATANKVLLSDGTNYVLSTPTFPNASATTRKIIVSDGTNWTASTETWAVPGTSGNVLTSDGTNWTSAAASGGGKFGGTGTDGALSTSSGTTTFDFSSANFLVKNYTSVSITGTAAVAGSNPATDGSVLILKSQGNVTGTASGLFDLRLMGGIGGVATAGAGFLQDGGPGTQGYGYPSRPGAGAGGIRAGAVVAYANWSKGTNASPTIYGKAVPFWAGGGGGCGMGDGGSTLLGGAGGRGGGGVYVECKGALNWTMNINVAGANGSNATGTGTGSSVTSSSAGGGGGLLGATFPTTLAASTGAGGGGGGGAGCVAMVYTSLTANSGTYTITGGTGGNAQGTALAGCDGAAGMSFGVLNTELV